MILLSNSANCTVLRAVVLTQYRRVTDRRTDGRTDGIAIANTALAMRALRSAVKKRSTYQLGHDNPKSISRLFGVSKCIIGLGCRRIFTAVENSFSMRTGLYPRTTALILCCVASADLSRCCSHELFLFARGRHITAAIVAGGRRSALTFAFPARTFGTVVDLIRWIKSPLLPENRLLGRWPA